MASTELIKAVAVTAELCGRTFSPEAAAVFVSDLDGFPDHAVIKALSRCRREVRGMLTIADVVSRVDDGRPSADEAWAMVPMDENKSVVWTGEMAQAAGIAMPLIEAGDKFGARQAFRSAYERLVSEARHERRPPQWEPSLGHGIDRSTVIIEAVKAGRLTIEHAKRLPFDDCSTMGETFNLENVVKRLQ